MISWRDGSKLYVSNLGRPYPLRGIGAGDDGGQIDFSEYGSEFQIAAPEGSVEIDRLAVGPALVEAFGSPDDDFYESDVSAFAGSMRRCGRELVRPGPPSQRMQPAYDMVIRACQEYDKGADCLEHALTVWDLPHAPAPAP